MYPLIRFAKTSLQAALKGKMEIDAVGEITFRCRPWDLDIFMEMNNGRVLTLYDLGRFNLAIRSGLSKVLRQNSWGLVVAGSTVRYRRRIKIFEKVTMRTQVVSFDERWVYIIQSMWVKGQPASSVLLRTGVTHRGKVLPTEQLMATMNVTDWKPQPQAWVKTWIESEEDRPWPPTF